MTEQDVRRIVLEMKRCLDPNHVACERCSPGYDERVRKWLEVYEEWLQARSTADASTGLQRWP